MDVLRKMEEKDREFKTKGNDVKKTFSNIDKKQQQFNSAKTAPDSEVPTWVSLMCSRRNCCGTESNFRSIDSNSLGIDSTFGEPGSPSDVSSLGSNNGRGFRENYKSKRGRMAVLFIILLILIAFIATAVGVTISYVYNRDIVRLHVDFSVDNYNKTLLHKRQQEAEAAEFCRKVKDAFRSEGLEHHFMDCKCVDTRPTISEVKLSFVLEFTDNKQKDNIDEIKRIVVSVVKERKRDKEFRSLYPQESYPAVDNRGPVELGEKKSKNEETTQSSIFLKTTPAVIKSTTQRNRQIFSKRSSTTPGFKTTVRSNVKSTEKVKVQTTTVRTSTSSTTPGMNAWDRILSKLNLTGRR
ncbi:uncharacterized protein LOC134268633 [Saccostrea cucullata]|uniref:uncharacterized protein LOC134268633 n=1 Tax=Saccostrea cuccullata TaxID=36930 RepID=UPI002ED389A6